jgi:hypothetical protein
MIAFALRLLRVPALPNDDPLRVALITAAPGPIYWERFGHNAILVEDVTTGDRRLYNYGWFDFGQENFLLNFVRGRMRYQLAATDPARDLANYRAEGRTVWLQELDLDRAQKNRLAARLAHEARPENAEYRYDYYLNNCSTKVRDALDAVLGGALREQSLGRGRGETFRSLSLAYARPIPWLALGIDLGLGPVADRRLNFWEEAFLPLRLRDAANDVVIRDGAGNARPLVRSQRVLFAGTHDDRVPARPAWWAQMLAVGVLLSALVAVGLRGAGGRGRTLAAGVAAMVSLAIGLIGCGLLGLWFATDHEIAYRNANVALFSPLALLLVLPLWRLRDPASAGRGFARFVAAAIVASAVLVFGAGLVKFVAQSQAHWFALLAPWHLAICALLWRRHRAVPAGLRMPRR